MKPGTPITLRQRKTKFVEIFRTTPVETVCPNFYVLAHANGCRFQPLCRYCYLKSSLWFLQTPQAFTNAEDMIQEISDWVEKDELESVVLNSGNLSDSLAFEKDRPLFAQLVETMREKATSKGRPHTLLLVTKGGAEECRPLLQIPPCDNVVLSFSINNPDAARKYEAGAAPAEERIRAAAALARQGWRVRVRIDPMIQGYSYRALSERVKALAPERVTLGTLRAEPSLFKQVKIDIFSGLEKAPAPNALARYPLGVRLALYREALEGLADTCSTGLCEETPDVWDALGLDRKIPLCNCCE